MKNKITRYSIIERNNLSDLADTVEAYIIRGGWEPQGGITVNIRDTMEEKKYLQAMIYREPNNEKV